MSPVVPYNFNYFFTAKFDELMWGAGSANHRVECMSQWFNHGGWKRFLTISWKGTKPWWWDKLDY